KYKSGGGGSEFLGEASTMETGAKVLDLDDAMEAGITYGRDYLTQRERVFISALDLTLARWRLTPIFNVNGSGLRAGDSRNAQVQQNLTELVSTNTMAQTRTIGVNWLAMTGARVSADFTQDFLRFITGNRSINESDLAVSVVQPLLKGGGTRVTMEALTQEERDLLYDLRNFANFRRSFIVDVVSDYYNVLQARDQVRNSYVAYQGFLKNDEREQALAEEDRRTKTQIGLLRQATLSSESRWINSIRNYQTRLDNLKLSLGLPVEKQIMLDDKELQKLRIESLPLTRDEAVGIALVTRPEIANVNDQVVDAERRIEVAKNGLLPGVDVGLDYNTVSNQADTTPGINFDRRRWSTSLDVDLPLDRKSERNTYRVAFITLDRAKRNAEAQEDQVRLQIYDDWRALDQAQLNFEIAEKGVELAIRRLEEQNLLQDLGRGEARDLIDAQNDLLSARNQRTSTVVDHTLARLRLWRDMGILYIKEDGSWVKKLENESL
ncbi:TolC family protein, partial [Verrucomicrobiales bacterium]|nr:TolC family protein [Verrucomicrobiales bacterium]